MKPLLKEFLASPQRPEDCLSYNELLGFLFAVACSPEVIKPSEWLPMIFNEQDAGYANMEEGKSVQQQFLDLYSTIHGQVMMRGVTLPSEITIQKQALDNVDGDLGQWCRGFIFGHEWLIELWRDYTPDELDEELVICVMVLSFFSTHNLARAHHQEITGPSGKSLEDFAQTLLDMFENAMNSYAHIGQSIQLAMAELYQADKDIDHSKMDAVKTDQFTPLDDDEFDYLKRFLSLRVDDDTYSVGMDEGVFGMSGLDGFFTAIVSGPEMIPPSIWLQDMWGDFEPEWADDKEFEHIFSLLVRHMNAIVAMLLEEPEDFEPIFYENYMEGKPGITVDEWCEGYVRGMALTPEAWDESGEQLAIYFLPIFAFTEAGEWRGHELELYERENLQRAIPDSAREIHAYWLAQRDEYMPNNSPVKRSESHVGRNDPCPCGSGKKYKKCCLH